MIRSSFHFWGLLLLAFLSNQFPKQKGSILAICGYRITSVGKCALVFLYFNFLAFCLRPPSPVDWSVPPHPRPAPELNLACITTSNESQQHSYMSTFCEPRTAEDYLRFKAKANPPLPPAPKRWLDIKCLRVTCVVHVGLQCTPFRITSLSLGLLIFHDCFFVGLSCNLGLPLCSSRVAILH